MISSIRSGYTTNQMKNTQNQLMKYSKQVASGKRVNSAADDAAALSISMKMLNQIGTYKQTSNNISSQIDAGRIADGALSGVSDTYNDMYANSIRAMNGTMSESDRAATRQVNDALKDSVNQIASNTKYNEKQVIDNIDTNFDSLDSEAISSAASKITSDRSKIGAKENGMLHQQAAYDIAQENTTAAYSRKIDAEMEKAISAYKNQSIIGQFQNSLLGMQIQQENGITALFK